MTRLLLVLSILLLAPDALAQTYPVDKGSYIFGGAARFSSQGTTISSGDFEAESDRLTDLVLNVDFGYFVTPGLALGIFSQLQTVSQGDISQTVTNAGPSIAYYFGQATSKAYPFISGNVGFASQRIEVDGESAAITGFGFGAAGGVSYMIARNVALTGALFYQNQSFSDSGVTEATSAFGFQGGVTAFIF